LLIEITSCLIHNTRSGFNCVVAAKTTVLRNNKDIAGALASARTTRLVAITPSIPWGQLTVLRAGIARASTDINKVWARRTTVCWRSNDRS
jgi:hypothetical protein